MRQSKLSFYLLLLTALFSSACARSIPAQFSSTPPIAIPRAEELSASRDYVFSRAKRFGHRVIRSGVQYRRVERIKNRFTSALGIPQGMWPHYVIRAQGHVNAVALNQNTIVVYEELLEKVENDNTLAFILAHEVAHLILRHGGKESTVTRRLFAEEKHQVHNVELQADRMGAIVFAAAGYDPSEAPHHLERALRLFGDVDTEDTPREGIRRDIPTHPKNQERVETLKKALAPALEIYEEIAAQFPI